MQDDKVFQGDRWTHGNDNLKFSVVKLAFYEEDLKKMEGMSPEEQYLYRIELRKKGRFTIADE